MQISDDITSEAACAREMADRIVSDTSDDSLCFVASRYVNDNVTGTAQPGGCDVYNVTGRK